MTTLTQFHNLLVPVILATPPRNMLYTPVKYLQRLSVKISIWYSLQENYHSKSEKKKIKDNFEET